MYDIRVLRCKNKNIFGIGKETNNLKWKETKKKSRAPIEKKKEYIVNYRKRIKSR